MLSSVALQVARETIRFLVRKSENLQKGYAFFERGWSAPSQGSPDGGCPFGCRVQFEGGFMETNCQPRYSLRLAWLLNLK